MSAPGGTTDDGGPDADSLRRFRELLEHAGDALLVVDPATLAVVDANRGACEDLGYDRDELLGRRADELLAFPELARGWAQVIEGLEFSVRDLRPGEMTRADGGRFAVEVGARWVPLDDGPRVVVLARDLGDRPGAFEGGRARQERWVQAEKLSALGQILSGVAHELNNPLTAVMGYCELLATDPLVLDHDRLRADVDTIRREAERCQRIAKGLLTFARQGGSEKRPVSVNEIARAALELGTSRLRHRDVVVETELAADLPPVHGDPYQLQQVLVNLFLNAEHAMLEARAAGTATGPGRLRVTTRDVGEKVRVEVEDSGPGIPAEERKRIFEPFFTTKGVGEGTGLGLSVSLGIVQEHGGRMWAESPLGGGALLVVELPAGEMGGATGAGRAPADASGGEATPATGEGLRVLVIDDEEGIRSLLARALDGLGVELEQAADGLAARETLRRGRFDVVLCDLRMPGLQGEELFRWAREHRPDLARRWVFVTASVGEGTSEFLRSTGRPCLFKPFRLAEIQRVVREVAGASDAAAPGPGPA